MFISCFEDKQIFVNCSNPELDYTGRVHFLDNEVAEIFWTGTSIKMNFEGESVSATLKDETGKNYYNVIVNNKLTLISLYLCKLSSLKNSSTHSQALAC